MSKLVDELGGVFIFGTLAEQSVGANAWRQMRGGPDLGQAMALTGVKLLSEPERLVKIKREFEDAIK